MKPLTRALLDRRATSHFKPDPAAVGREFGLLENAEVAALLALGYAQEPDKHKQYGGRLELAEFVRDEHFDHPWKDGQSPQERHPSRTAQESEVLKPA